MMYLLWFYAGLCRLDSSEQKGIPNTTQRHITNRKLTKLVSTYPDSFSNIYMYVRGVIGTPLYVRVSDAEYAHHTKPDFQTHQL